MTDEQWTRVLDVTLNGTFRCTRAALRHMIAERRRRHRQQRLGARLAGPGGQAHYAAAKAGVMALTRCAAIEAAPHGVRVNAVAPSLAMHPFLAKVTTDELLAELTEREAFGRAAEPWEVANVIVFLASDYSSLHDRRGRLGQQPAPLGSLVPEAFIVDAVRTPVGRRGGGLSALHPADLGAQSSGPRRARRLRPRRRRRRDLRLPRRPRRPGGQHRAHRLALRGVPRRGPGVTIDRQCGSSQQAVHFAAQAVMSGTQDLVVAGGVEIMSPFPISAAMLVGRAVRLLDPFAGSEAGASATETESSSSAAQR